MKKLLSIVAAILFAATTFAKESELNEVTLTTIGTGASKEQAVNQALRSAIEQSFGSFVSANTSIVNDKLTKDEIVSLSSGNIKKYEELSCVILPNGNTMVALKAIVSIKKLTTYAKSHGSSCEFAGNTFAQNMKLRELYSQNETKVIDNMLKQIEQIAPQMFNFSINVTGEPQEERRNNNYKIPVSISISATENSEAVYELFLSTMSSIRLQERERADYKATNSTYYEFTFINYVHYPLPEETIGKLRYNEYAHITENGKEIPRTELLKNEEKKGVYYLRNPFPTDRLLEAFNKGMNYNVYAQLNGSKEPCYCKMDQRQWFIARIPSYASRYDRIIMVNNFHQWSHLTKSTDTSHDFLIAGAIKKAKAKKYNKEKHYGSILVENGYIIVPRKIIADIKGFEINKR